VSELDLDRLKGDLATLDRMLVNLDVDLKAKKEFAVSLEESLELREECVRILRSPTICIVILKEYKEVCQEIKDIKKKFQQTKAGIKAVAEQFINTKVERQRIAKLLHHTETAKEPCGKLLKFELVKISKED